MRQMKGRVQVLDPGQIEDRGLYLEMGRHFRDLSRCKTNMMHLLSELGCHLLLFWQQLMRYKDPNKETIYEN